jgi:hypothetical protein
LKERVLLAPHETLESFLERQKWLDQIDLPKEKNLSVPLYDLYELEAFVIHSNEDLFLWQGAVLWEYTGENEEKYPVIQLKKSFSKLYLRMYQQEELLAHELVHAVRCAFKEPIFEEVFAYRTSSNRFRRFFGPLFMYPFESTVFAAICLLAPLISIVTDSFLGIGILLSTLCLFTSRLLVLHLLFSLCRRNLEKAGVLPSFSLAVMVRLSDREIIKTALRSTQKTLDYFTSQGRKEYRLQEILRAYFKR